MPVLADPITKHFWGKRLKQWQSHRQPPVWSALKGVSQVFRKEFILEF